MKILFLSSIFLSISLFACQPKIVRKPITKIEVEGINQIIKYGENLEIQFSVNSFKSKLIKLSVFIDGNLIMDTEEYSTKINVDTKKYLVGNHLIKTIALNSANREGTNYYSFFITSDIEPKLMKYTIVGSVPHNTKYFTQGLEFYDNTLYESTGDYGTSSIYSYESNFQKISKSVDLDRKYFGEGITILNDKIYQLTYKSRIGFVYDLHSFEKIGNFSFPSSEGWGLTNDGKSLIMSDGSANISYLDPNDFHLIKKIEVCNTQGNISRLNELEYVDGYIYSNIWTTDLIIKIDATTGKVVEQINMHGLLDQLYTGRVDVLNGIAYRKDENLFYVTGKLWPFMYKVSFTE